MLNCCLVSKYWRQVLLPLLWCVDDTRLMSNVSMTLLKKYKDYVRIYGGMWDRFTKDYANPPIYTQLRELSIGNAVRTNAEAMQLIGANNHLKKLEMYQVRLFELLNKNAKEDASNNNNNNNNQNKDTNNDCNDNMHSSTNPLGHLRTTLQELTVIYLNCKEKELYYLLRSVAQGKLRYLKLHFLSGTFDLQNLVFESLTRLCLLLDHKIPGLHEIIGRSPHVEYLELGGLNNFFSIDSLVHILRGTHPVETLRQREERLRSGLLEPLQYSRPQLKTLYIYGLHMYKRQDDSTDKGNDAKFLELIQACSSIYNKHKWTGHLDSLQQLDIQLWLLDDQAREAIEMHSSTLEVLKIKILRSRERTPWYKKRRHGQDLQKLLQSCTRLRKLEFLDQCGDEDISAIMTDLIGDHGTRTNHEDKGHNANNQKVELWNCLNLESLTLKSTRLHHSLDRTREEEEKRYYNDDEGDGGFGTWVMLKVQWDPVCADGTGFLLDTQWSNFELFEDVMEDIGRPKEGEELIKRFLRHVSPSTKLRRLQLGQLTFIRSV
ncbi:hypothetical protein BGZ65_012413 [Modicella reniformis]|uniref:Uncharacterized protein n=1 Tax=Modicella reniformis TaxID=1440133 RepID=A0A9P6MAG2_9FUNG|nr:hypothetical protein BGZ65_012413 [Modicella reniformis]